MQNDQILIWKYIDGECSEAEKKAVEARLFIDPAFRTEWDRCKALQTELSKQQPEQPSLRFQANVVDSVFKVLPAKPAQEILPRSFVRWMAGLGSALTAALSWAALNVSPYSHSHSRFDHVMDSSLARLAGAIPYSTFFMVAIVATTLAALYLLDISLRRFFRT
jgi:anti-sigma factor RsiW